MGQRVHGGAEKGFGGAGAARLLGYGRGGCEVETGCRSRGVLKGGVPMISEVGYGRESPEITTVISAWLVGVRGGSGDDGADQRGLGVSERGARGEGRPAGWARVWAAHGKELGRRELLRSRATHAG